MLNNDLVNLKAIIAIVIFAVAIGLIIWRFNKQTKAIMGNFAALLVVFWDEVKEKFGI